MKLKFMIHNLFINKDTYCHLLLKNKNNIFFK